tara:strand:+ start:439 stop:576 length:138 start_codon:yes stop_codon:yes gene_type:complete
MQKFVMFLFIICLGLSFQSCIGDRATSKGYNVKKSCCGCGAYGNP